MGSATEALPSEGSRYIPPEMFSMWIQSQDHRFNYDAATLAPRHCAFRQIMTNYLHGMSYSLVRFRSLLEI